VGRNDEQSVGIGSARELGAMSGIDDRVNPVIAPSPRGAFVGAWESWALFPRSPVPDIAYVFRGFLVEADGEGR
jgi:hypothetical protein